MKITAVLLATLALASAGVAAASEKFTDVDYLKANRCRGLAESLGGDTAGLDSLIKAEGRVRVDAIYTQGQKEMARGKKEASGVDARERLTAELNGPCMAYVGAGRGSASAH